MAVFDLLERPMKFAGRHPRSAWDELPTGSTLIRYACKTALAITLETGTTVTKCHGFIKARSEFSLRIIHLHGVAAVFPVSIELPLVTEDDGEGRRQHCGPGHAGWHLYTTFPVRVEWAFAAVDLLAWRLVPPQASTKAGRVASCPVT